MGGHAESRKSRHGNCAHPSDGHVAKPSSLPPAWLSPWHELQQMFSQNGETTPAPAIGWYEPSVSATSMQTFWCCRPSMAPEQSAMTMPDLRG